MNRFVSLRTAMVVGSAALLVGLAGCSRTTYNNVGKRGNTSSTTTASTTERGNVNTGTREATQIRSTTAGGESGGAAATPTRPTMVGDMARAVLAYPTGDERTSALKVEKLMPTEVRAGQPFTYELRVQNLTGTALENVTINETPTGSLAVRESEPSFARGGDGMLTWALGSLAPRDTRVIRVSAAAGGGATTIGSCTTASYNTSMCMTANVVEPALKVTKTVTRADGTTGDGTPCDSYRIVYEVCNTGTGTLRGVQVRDSLPAGFTFDGQQTFTGNAGDLAAGQCKTFTGVGKASGPGSFFSRPSASGEGITAEGNNAGTNVVQPELSIAVACAEQRFFGAPAVFNVTVRNTGAVPANDVVVLAPLPAGTTFDKASESGRVVGGSVNWNLGTIPPGGSREFSFGVNPNATETVIANATVRGGCAVEKNASCQTRFRGIPAVLLEVVDSPDPVLVGENTTYTITVTNQGTANDSNIEMKVTLPEGAQFVSAEGVTRGTFAGGFVTFAPYPTLAPGARIQWTVVVKALASGDMRPRFEMDTAETTQNVTETEATRFYEFR